ncbi:MAG: DNA glycosylase [Verrucomicrobiota bacterium]
MEHRAVSKTFPVEHYDLGATLSSGQAFRWKFRDGAWEGVIGSRWVQLRQNKKSITVTTSRFSNDWFWLENYLQLQTDLPKILATFPDDEPMRAAIAACRGLRLLRQDPWECLASFILSSTKQIVQIRQIVALLCERFGEKTSAPDGVESSYAFPTFRRMAELSERDLRDCKMGFRAPYLLGTAQILARGGIDLEGVRSLSVEHARNELLKFPGVGNKIADCVLLFAYGFQEAFPVDVWVMKALQQLYFPKRRAKLKRLHHFSKTHFGANAGYAQQYLFHYMRTKNVTAKI